MIFLHELGHSMGLSHGRKSDSDWKSPRSLDHGAAYGVDGKFGTIMGKLHPKQLFKFSNPNAICYDDGEESLPCGIPVGRPNSADAVSALNTAAPFVAGFFRSVDEVSVGLKRPQPIPWGENLVRNTEFEFEDTGDFELPVFPHWRPTGDGEWLALWPVFLHPHVHWHDVVREHNGIRVDQRETPQSGVTQDLEVARITPQRPYRLSVTAVLSERNSEDVVHIDLRATLADGSQVEYRVSGEVHGRYFTEISGIIYLDLPQAPEAMTLSVHGPAPELDLTIAHVGLFPVW
jgi:hypothetical protein